MTKKKGNAPSTKPAAPQPSKKQAAPTKSSPTRLFLIAGAVVLAIVAIVALANTKPQGTGAAQADPQEAKYIGRLLPAGYEEPKVADVVTYSQTANMKVIQAADAGTELSIPVQEVVDAKIVRFDYAQAGGKPIPMLAFVKPSGKIFVGVSFCPPCEGEGQRIETDLTLTCESCGTKRNVETGVGISGACKLYPLDEMPVKIVDGKIVVEKAALDSWTPQPKDRPVG